MRHGVTFRIPVQDIARGSGALLRGVAVERLLRPDSVDGELLEEMHVAFMRGIEVP